jgi:ApaG protein
MYIKSTRDIRILVEPQFAEQQSKPADHKYIWTYRIIIENRSNDTVQLLARHWQITDSNGNTQDVKGEGVVGKQPTLPPGTKFEYESGCPLSTPSGFMMGSYQMVNRLGEKFDVEIPPFSLDSPHDVRVIN